MRIDPKHLLILAEIMDSGGFTEAAASLGTTQPALSRGSKCSNNASGSPLVRSHPPPLSLPQSAEPLWNRDASFASPPPARTRASTGSGPALKANSVSAERPFHGRVRPWADRRLPEGASEHHRSPFLRPYGRPRERCPWRPAGCGSLPGQRRRPAVEVEFKPLIEGRNIIAAGSAIRCSRRGG